jgi:hypothetical protein
MSARISHILILLLPGLATLSDHVQESLVPGVEPGLKLRRIPARRARAFPRNHLVLTFLDIADRSIEPRGAQVKKPDDLLCGPTLIEVGQHVVKGDSRARDLRTPPAADDRRFIDVLGSRSKESLGRTLHPTRSGKNRRTARTALAHE